MRIPISICINLALLGVVTQGQTPSFDWVEATNPSIDALAINTTVDRHVNLLITRCFRGTATIGGISLTSGGHYDLFVAKFRPNGSLIWLRHAAGETLHGGQARGRGIAIDANDDFYVEGTEYRVLKGMRHSLAKWEPRPAILCEIGWEGRHPAWQRGLEAFADLKALGCSFQRLDGRSVCIG